MAPAAPSARGQREQNMTKPDFDPLQAEIDAALAHASLQDFDPDGAAPARRRGGPRDRRLQRGSVVGTSGDDVIVELGPRVQGVLPVSEFDEPPAVGAVFEFSLNGQGEDGLWNLSRKEAKVLAAWNDLHLGARVETQVSAVNKGGLDCKVGPLRAFMPASHVDLARIDDLAALVGQRFEAEVVELDAERNRIVLSRRAVLSEEREAKRRDALGRIVPGIELSGQVTRVEAFGAFVDIGGVEGLVHVSNLSRQRVADPNERVKKGDHVRVLVLEVKDGGKRIGLGMKQLEPDPWDEAEARLAADDVVSGKVVRLMEFGAFVEVLPGIEGLLHVSQMLPNQRVNRPGDVVQIGQELTVRVLSVSASARRISLSRLDPRGALIGSEDAADATVIDAVLDPGQQQALGTNLGSLFKRALGGT